jgi:hypothetical protein
MFVPTICRITGKGNKEMRCVGPAAAIKDLRKSQILKLVPYIFSFSLVLAVSADG